MTSTTDNLVLREGERWFLVHSRNHREAGARLQLENQGFRTFLPQLEKTRRHARKQDKVLVPFFPRYLFIILNLDRDRWQSVNGTYGVERLVAGRSRPLPVPEGLVEALIECADARGVLHSDAASLSVVNRDMGNRAGSFANQIGQAVHLDDIGRQRILFDFLGPKL